MPSCFYILTIFFILFLASINNFISAAYTLLSVGSNVNQMSALAYDPSKDVLILGSYGYNSLYRYELSTNLLSHIGGTIGSSGSLDSSGPSFAGTTAKITWSPGIAVIFPSNSPRTSSGYVFADVDNHCLRHMLSTSPFTIKTAAGSCGNSGVANGVGGVARFNSVYSVSFLPKSRKLIIGQEGAHCVKLGVYP
jgi:hypothetical protein